MEIAIIILNWNGEKHLQCFLPTVVASSTVKDVRIIVADNGSTDTSVEWVRNNYPQVEIICFHENHGFAGGYNLAIEQITAEVIVLLNNDVETTSGWLNPLQEALEKHPDVAAVQPKIKDWNEKNYFEYAGACGGYIDRLGFPFCRGRILALREEDKGQYDDEREIFWCSGAALCIRRSAYIAAGGLDERFFAHMEEIDLCWRLRNQGWKLMVAPSATVFHLGGGSLPQKHPRKLYLNYRNNLIMLYKNLHRKEWKKLIWQRFFLDSAAAFLFLLKREFGNVDAVIKAYQSFLQMKKHYSHRQKKEQDDCIYRRSIIFDYYFRRVRKYSDLSK